RWDLVVVNGTVDPELPRDVPAILKRAVGLPGESLFLAHGDVYAAAAGGLPSLARKPDDLIAALLVPVHEARGLAEPWTWIGPGTRDELPGGGTRLTAGAAPGGLAVFESFVDDGLPGQPGETPVGDTALRVVVGAGDGV